jgi:hypothetical protein
MAIDAHGGKSAVTLPQWAENFLIAPADIASLAVFRILFGTLMAGAMVRYLAKGWVHEFFLRPTFFFPYEGFAWLRPLPGGWMHAVVILVALAAVGIAAGCFYRWSAPIFFARVHLPGVDR